MGSVPGLSRPSILHRIPLSCSTVTVVNCFGQTRMGTTSTWGNWGSPAPSGTNTQVGAHTFNRPNRRAGDLVRQDSAFEIPERAANGDDPHDAAGQIFAEIVGKRECS